MVTNTTKTVLKKHTEITLHNFNYDNTKTLHKNKLQ